MAHRPIQRALLSVYDKTGLVALARALAEEFGVEILSTGGTADVLRENAIPVTLVEDVTGSPEMLDGRVKTLHPAIHAAILADRDDPAHMRQLVAAGLKPIDLVVVNLYPFEETVSRAGCTFAQGVDMIDIGGPALLRAAAKNHRHVRILHRPSDYDRFLDELRRGGGSAPVSPQDAEEVFAETSRYDAAVMAWLERQSATTAAPEPAPPPSSLPRILAIHLCREPLDLRYGENPHQRAGLYRECGGEARAARIVGLPAVEGMSFNNYLDASAALELCRELAAAKDIGGSAVCCFIKHNNACGAGAADSPIEAYERAYLGDPNAAMGGVLACSFDITKDFAASVMDTFAHWGKPAGAGGFFVEVWIAPSFDAAAADTIRTAKPWGQRVRLLPVGDVRAAPGGEVLDFRRIAGGALIQERDTLGLSESEWKIVTKRLPTESERRDLRLAWLIAKHTRSNAISVCRDGMLLGSGAGQMSRVMSCRIAAWLARDNGHAGRLAGSAAASDAFFPFSDGPRILLDTGVSALIQPGGSRRDDETIALCDERSAAMIFTGTRHFRH